MIWEIFPIFLKQGNIPRSMRGNYSRLPIPAPVHWVKETRSSVPMWFAYWCLLTCSIIIAILIYTKILFRDLGTSCVLDMLLLLFIWLIVCYLLGGVYYTVHVFIGCLYIFTYSILHVCSEPSLFVCTLTTCPARLLLAYLLLLLVCVLTELACPLA